mmetsp:Transcript_11883/g.17707  ORF Transcript_11883/g.17707 Transcript_11883/m.17707 type:complete len:317 (+) Transcript_11883:980-1930(+)
MERKHPENGRNSGRQTPGSNTTTKLFTTVKFMFGKSADINRMSVPVKVWRVGGQTFISTDMDVTQFNNLSFEGAGTQKSAVEHSAVVQPITQVAQPYQPPYRCYPAQQSYGMTFDNRIPEINYQPRYSNQNTNTRMWPHVVHQQPSARQMVRVHSSNRAKLRYSRAQQVFSEEPNVEDTNQTASSSSQVQRSTKKKRGRELFSVVYSETEETKSATNDTNKKGKRRKNEAKKLYKCSLCVKTFDTKYRIDRHIRSHTDERPYKCQYCPKRFRQKAHLTTHIRVIHNPTLNEKQLPQDSPPPPPIGQAPRLPLEDPI